MKNQDLKGKCAIVTGASLGIGRAVAIAFAREGARVMITSRGQSGGADALFTVQREIASCGGKAAAVQGDVSQVQDVQTIVQRCLTEFGRIDVLVNNAGIYPDYHTPLVDYPLESWDETMAVNLRGVFLSVKTVLPTMIAQKAGSIINISSIAAVRAGKGRIAYGVSKAGLERLTFGLADEVKEFNIAVNALCPIGVTDTAGARKTFLEQNPDHWVQPEDVAKGAVWLARQSAATFTGRAVMAPAHRRRTLFLYGGGLEERPWVHID